MSHLKDGTIFARSNYGSFSFLPPLRHVSVVNISRTSISLSNVHNKNVFS